MPAEPQHRCASATGTQREPGVAQQRARRRRESACRAAACTADETPRVRDVPRASICGASSAHAAATSSTGSRASAAMRCGLARAYAASPREQVAVLAHHDAAAARSHDDRLGAALDVRPPRIDVAPRERARLVVLGQVVRQRAAAAAAFDARSPRCRRDRARAPSPRRCSARATAARSRAGSAPCARAAARGHAPAPRAVGDRRCERCAAGTASRQRPSVSAAPNSAATASRGAARARRARRPRVRPTRSSTNLRPMSTSRP